MKQNSFGRVLLISENKEKQLVAKILLSVKQAKEEQSHFTSPNNICDQVQRNAMIQYHFLSLISKTYLDEGNQILKY
jgi:hypothetical protein